MTYNNVHIVIVAGGKGTRFSDSLPKQFHLIGGKPVLAHTIGAFTPIVPIGNIVVVLAAEMKEFWEEQCQVFDIPATRIVAGGATRWESVRNGVLSIDAPEGSIVLVHDAARPLVEQELITRVIESVTKGHEGAVPVVKLRDSVREVIGDSSRPFDRETLRAVQTPQAFRLGNLRQGFSAPYNECFTDEATMMQHAGFTDIELTEGSYNNFKITLPQDLLLAQILLQDAR